MALVAVTELLARCISRSSAFNSGSLSRMVHLHVKTSGIMSCRYSDWIAEATQIGFAVAALLLPSLVDSAEREALRKTLRTAASKVCLLVREPCAMRSVVTLKNLNRLC